MKSLKIKAEPREVLGKKESNRLREKGMVPAAMYDSDGVVHIAIPFSDLRPAIYTTDVFLLDVDVAGENYTAILQDMQWHPVEELLLHADLLRVNENRPIKIDIPVILDGIPRGVKNGGKLNFSRRKLRIKALPKNVPDEIKIDITKLKIGDSIKIEDLDEGDLNFLDDPTNVIVGVVVTRMVVPVDDDDEDEEGEEGEESEGDPADVPATEQKDEAQE